MDQQLSPSDPAINVNPDVAIEDAPVDEKVRVVSPLRLMWWKFRRHKAALFSGVFLIAAYFVTIFAGFFAPYAPNQRTPDIYVPPQSIRFVDSQGNFHLRPFVYGLTMTRDMETLLRIYDPDPEVIRPLQFFVQGEPYKILGFIEWDVHLFSVEEGYITLFGTDELGRDVLSRLIYGAQISLSIGLVSVALSLMLGLIIGGISGLYGGIIDDIIQRIIEAIIAIPSIPLWMGLAAAVPREWSPVQQYFAILVVLSLVSWTSTARVARGRFLAVREMDFVMAARLYGSRQWHIIVRHLIPNIMSYAIVTVTLAIPRIIIAESALSFIGVGLNPPVVSWGVLLKEAQKNLVVQFYPWLWIGPAICIIAVVLAFNFVGDGARDAADPFAST